MKISFIPTNRTNKIWLCTLFSFLILFATANETVTPLSFTGTQASDSVWVRDSLQINPGHRGPYVDPPYTDETVSGIGLSGMTITYVSPGNWDWIFDITFSAPPTEIHSGKPFEVSGSVTASGSLQKGYISWDSKFGMDGLVKDSPTYVSAGHDVPKASFTAHLSVAPYAGKEIKLWAVSGNIVAWIATYHLSTSPPKPKPPSTDDPTPIIKIISIKGDAGFLHGNDDWQELSEGQQLTASDQIHTGPESEVTMELISPAFARSNLHGHIVVIKSLTQIKMRQFSDPKDINKIELLLKIGEIKAQIHRQETIRVDFSIKTPTATMSVRGTIFTVRHVEATQVTTTGVEEGTVLVTPTNTSLKPFQLQAGHQVEIFPKHIGSIISSATKLPPKTLNWPLLAGDWLSKTKVDSSGKPASIYQDGKNLIFRNEYGKNSTGYFESLSRIKATQWAGGLGATISDDGNTIKWDNGSIWQRVKKL